MATKVVKDKEHLKKIAKENGTTVSKILSVAIKKEIKRHKEREKGKDKICKRVVATEEKLQEIKLKLEKRRQIKKTSYYNSSF